MVSWGRTVFQELVVEAVYGEEKKKIKDKENKGGRDLEENEEKMKKREEGERE